MPPFFNNKKLIILLTSLIILVALIGFSMKEREQISWPEQFVHDTVGLFQYTFSKPARYVAGFFQNLQDIRNVYEENKVLKSHLQKYAELDSNYQVLKSQYDELKKQLNISSIPDLTDYKSYVAFVIGRSFDNWNQQITVNKGLKQGIKKGMPVVTADGFIGKVTEVSQFTSVVTLVTDPSNYNQISAEVIKSGVPIDGMIEGYDDKKNELLFKKIPIDAKITKGDKVVSSGLGKVYPQGILIGTVTKVSTDQYGLTKTAEVKPAANFNNIEYVDILERLAPSVSGGDGGS
ncbi:rod shape-determining protein MreC [Pullulanibacillus sp. KACC 23026]|uniref:rod shape-determining protein MreC n=1 Tax=Pullulanibacillus sp. KACC 23026 TaxID=3028315 RepID=UPI0023B05904|nr:rod shape-determining protein MreC [Pullulanibacillus sp. KACC 23026]WEG14051.1 rod shape-determining protein MreC [Pullulanibacillus sp. KACC 23026]